MIEPYRTLVCGCPRHFEGHKVVRIPLPARADDVLKAMGATRCHTVVRTPENGDPGYCDNALMFLRVES